MRRIGGLGLSLVTQTAGTLVFPVSLIFPHARANYSPIQAVDPLGVKDYLTSEKLFRCGGVDSKLTGTTIGEFLGGTEKADGFATVMMSMSEEDIQHSSGLGKQERNDLAGTPWNQESKLDDPSVMSGGPLRSSGGGFHGTVLRLAPKGKATTGGGKQKTLKEFLKALGHDKYLSALNKQDVKTVDDLRSVIQGLSQADARKELRDYGLSGKAASDVYNSLSLPSAPRFMPKNFKFQDYLDSAINNKRQPAFVEREKTIAAIKTVAVTALNKPNKPTAIVLFSPRGTGKTAVVRHLALNNLDKKSLNFKDLGDSGRLLVFNWTSACELLDDELKQRGRIVGGVMLRSLILFHCSKIFAGSSVPLGNTPIVFPESCPSLSFLYDCFLTAKPFSVNSTYDALMSQFGDVDSALGVWDKLTRAAFGLNGKVSRPTFLFDTTEELVMREVGGFHKKKGTHPRIRRTMFSDVAAALPQRTVSLFVGTTDPHTQFGSLELTRFYTRPISSLPGLSLAGADKMMKKWRSSNSILKPEGLKLVWLWTCGVPRLLEFAFTFHSKPYSARSALVHVKGEVDTSYGDAHRFLAKLSVQDLAAIILACAARWEVEPSDCVPGSKLVWSDLFRTAAVFPASGKTATLPRYWIPPSRIPEIERSKLWLPGMQVEGLYPDVETLLEQRPGATQAGVPFEVTVGNALVARYRVFCLAHRKASTSFIPLNELFPSKDPHLKAVLKPYSVCLKDGLVKPKVQVFANMIPKKMAIVLNKETTNAHHDLLLPVRRRGTSKLRYIALQCRYGKPKGAEGLRDQIYCLPKAARGKRPEVPVLLQVTSGISVSKQKFTDKSLEQFQKKERYAMVGANSFSQWVNLYECFK